MLNVFCVNVGDRYDMSYVSKLRAMFDRNLKIDYNFYCATDKPAVEIPRMKETRFIQPRRKCWGWWNLQEAYANPSWAEGGPILYCGLDTVITRDITSVVEERIEANYLTYHHDFTKLVSTNYNEFIGTYGDGITFVPAGGIPKLWDLFMEKVPANSHYPMHLFNTRALIDNDIYPDFWEDVAPGFLTSYKWPTVKTELPPEPVICFHGEPRPAQAAIETPWILEHWRE